MRLLTVIMKIPSMAVFSAFKWWLFAGSKTFSPSLPFQLEIFSLSYVQMNYRSVDHGCYLCFIAVLGLIPLQTAEFNWKLCFSGITCVYICYYFPLRNGTCLCDWGLYTPSGMVLSQLLWGLCLHMMEVQILMSSYCILVPLFLLPELVDIHGLDM